MSTPDKTVGTSLITHQHVTNPATVVGSAVDTLTSIRATVFLFHGFTDAATANTDPQKWLIQGSAQTSGNEDWITLKTVNITFAGTITTEALTATEAAGVKVLAVADEAEYVSGDGVYILDAGTATDSEWALVEQVVVNTSVDIIDGLTTGKDSSDFLFDNPQTEVVYIELEGINRIRIVYMNEGATAANTAIKANMTTLDSYSIENPHSVV